jgi:hypothetical protein
MKPVKHPYPNSTPEFRFLKKSNGLTVFQVRYVCLPNKYTSAWADIPVVIEELNENVEEKAINE